MSLDKPSDRPRDESAPFVCTWQSEALESASVTATGALDASTAGRLGEVLGVALRRARLVLLNVHGVRFEDSAGMRAIISASVRAREVGSRVLVAGASSDTVARFARTGAGVEFLPAALPSTAVGQGHDDEDRRLGLRPLANPVNAQVLQARVMAVADLGLWLQAAGGSLHRAWVPAGRRPWLSAGASLEVYIDHRGTLNGWSHPDSGLAINQRRLEAEPSSREGAALAGRGDCGVVWQAAVPAVLIEHGERCLTCAGPLAFA